jgi:tRNA dimethylallyltransferase
MYRGGLLDEVATLRRRYPDWSPTASAAIGYAEANAVLDGAMPVDAAIERTVIRTRQYAKRQMTWFRHQLATAWIDVAADEPAEAVAARVQQAWESHGHTD